MATHHKLRSSIDRMSPARIVCAIRSKAAESSPMRRPAFVRGVREELGFRRAGSRIRAAIDSALKAAERRHVIAQTGDAVCLGYTSIGEYTLAELQGCLMAVVTRQPMDRGVAISLAARELGFRRTGPQIEACLRSAIRGLIRRKRLAGDTAHVWRPGARRRPRL